MKFWNNLTPKTKQILGGLIIIGIVVISCTLIYTGQLVPTIEAIGKK